ncbi:LytTr DNA-binding domain-containing protein [Algoriphagus locisalis]|uniref:LytTr DNA-binding domain-containing protein n=1 Tax=Algoriphagus locisalis TaxID=305507 RepID=A0A1I7E5E8_9BACT|nr:LytTR family DNA-binding domain-containing protein [Algoriphagus locisalis]SFU19142.1 LytTr DNA-binding domain-containing protein [Algoriphagus locisalis]
MEIKKLPVRYLDQFLRILLCTTAALLLAMYGSGARYLDSLSNNPFYIKLLAAFFIAAFFLEFVHQVTFQLDRKYDWKEKPLLRLLLQFSLGVLLPGVIDLFFLTIYQWYFEINTVQGNPSTHSSFPLMALPVFLFNIYYLIYYHILRKQESKPSKQTQRKTLLVQQGNRTIPIPLQDIRYIYHRNRINYLVTASQSSYFLNETLDELERKLPQDDFFRINRKMIIQYQACQDFRSNGHGKLLLHLSPSFPDDITVSQNKAGKFKEWIRR